MKVKGFFLTLGIAFILAYITYLICRNDLAAVIVFLGIFAIGLSMYAYLINRSRIGNLAGAAIGIVTLIGTLIPVISMELNFGKIIKYVNERSGGKISVQNISEKIGTILTDDRPKEEILLPVKTNNSDSLSFSDTTFTYETKIYDNGIYEGYFRNGVKTKFGIYNWSNGDKYTGQWDSDNRTGYGVYQWKVGDKYIGNFSNNTKNGYGIYISVGNKNSKYYVGNWSQNNMSGTGTYYNSDGNLIYYGKFENDKPIETYPTKGNYDSYKYKKISYNGDWYEGETKNGKPEGYGVYYWKAGGYWYGKWENGSRNGYGVYFSKDGEITTGKWIGNEKQ